MAFHLSAPTVHGDVHSAMRSPKQNERNRDGGDAVAESDGDKAGAIEQGNALCHSGRAVSIRKKSRQRKCYNRATSEAKEEQAQFART